MYDKQRVDFDQVRRITSSRGRLALRRFMMEQALEEARYHHRNREEIVDRPPYPTDDCPNIGQMLKLLSYAYIVDIRQERTMIEVYLRSKHPRFKSWRSRYYVRPGLQMCDLIWEHVLYFLEGRLFSNEDFNPDPELQARGVGRGRQIHSDAELSDGRLRMDHMLADGSNPTLTYEGSTTLEMAERFVQRARQRLDRSA